LTRKYEPRKARKRSFTKVERKVLERVGPRVFGNKGSKSGKAFVIFCFL